jgi:hypothetical protein
MVGGGIVGVGSAWMRWTISGSSYRNSYESLRSAQRLGIEELAPFRVIWFLVPVAVLAMIVLLGARIDRAAGLVGVGIGCVLVAFGGGVVLTPVAGGSGPWLACCAGLATAVASIVVMAQGGPQS